MQPLERQQTAEAMRIIDDVARRYGFTPSEYSPAGKAIEDDVHRRMGFAEFSEYKRAQPPPFLLLHVVLMDTHTELVVSVRTLHGGGSRTVMREIRDDVERRVQEQLPEWRGRSESGDIDAGLAP